MALSIESDPAPLISKKREIMNKAKTYSIPELVGPFKKNPLAPWTLAMATKLTMASPSAAGRVKKPRIIAIPPKNSVNMAKPPNAAGIPNEEKKPIVPVHYNN